ncbi:hypothetical protein KIH79_10685 [Bifidobacterium sp. 82T10]|uniref:Uncharacterized protein n=1 Tax=Bifidobacterium miconis TaxID=2834435 RepID=A0ABS6WH46_9BIFI|nr:hypothetical protein [Bifidobacterium miconis]MBW3093376.1 hypothetical protein [Bifidobacterium miconis]
MTREDSMALAIGEALLDLVVSSAPELARVDDMDGDGIRALAEVVEPATPGIEPVYGTLVFDYLLREQLVLERDLTERRNAADMPIHDGLVFVTDDHMHVHCFVGAIVHQENGGQLAIEFHPPFVGELIRGNAQRPLADRIRVGTYLVRLAGKVIGLFGDPLRVTGDPVGFFRQTVRFLRDLVRTARLEQGDSTSEPAQSADGAAKGTDNVPQARTTHPINLPHKEHQQ